MSARDAAIYLGLDAKRGAAWLEWLAEGGEVSHVWYLERFLFVASELQLSIALRWWRSEHVGADRRRELMSRRMQGNIEAVRAIVSDESPELRLRDYLSSCGESQSMLCPCTRDDARSLGWTQTTRDYPTRVNPETAETTVAMQLWASLSLSARRRAARLLACLTRSTSSG